MWSSYDNVVIDNIDSIYPYHSEECVLVFEFEETESKIIEVVGPEPEPQELSLDTYRLLKRFNLINGMQ